MKNDQTRNLNPHKEAALAMVIWGKEYSEQGGGSMDFWDQLPGYRQRICRDTIDRISGIKHRATGRIKK